ncbi:hypothetical protein DERP_013150 [Dermatophagoides pteronyssinus]|uniref:Uncharacterized protein n=1 Tax=Dermatophagoides pteronyssinus TaxID=6956 RepID=A0ABQ8J381_DERPT|nr:hypothetical protein DERP_013150 [Dermatophagoides pteronyssinus]
MLFKLKSFLYMAMKHIVNDYGTKQYRLLHSIEVFLFIYFFIRLCLLYLMFSDPEQYPFYQYDYGSAFFWQLTINRKSNDSD